MQEKSSSKTYERPQVLVLGSLQGLTRSGSAVNSDSIPSWDPDSNPNDAYGSGSPSNPPGS